MTRTALHHSIAPREAQPAAGPIPELLKEPEDDRQSRQHRRGTRVSGRTWRLEQG